MSFDIDLSNLLNDNLFKAGCLSYYSTGNVNDGTCHKSFPNCQYDVSMLEVSQIPILGFLDPSVNMDPSFPCPHLSRAIHVLKSDYTDLIVQQWTEVAKIIKSLDKNPYSSSLFMIPPGWKVGRHKHSGGCYGGCKQIITFCYTFNSGKITGERPSSLIMGDDPYIVNFPEQEKVVFTMLDDERHGTESNEWRFFWVYSYNDYVTLDRKLLDNFYLMEFDKHRFTFK